MEDWEEVFEELEDPRTGNAKRHLLHEVMMISLCAVLCGGETCADMALFGRAKRDLLQEFLTLPHGIPSHDTFSRIFRLLDPARFPGLSASCGGLPRTATGLLQLMGRRCGA